MVINTEAYDIVFKALKDYINSKISYDAYITKMPIQSTDKFPQVVITEEQNEYNLGTTRMEETISSLSYEINIYTQDKVIDNTKKSRVEIARELMKLVDTVMNQHYGMRRITCRPTPNIDYNIYRITMRYAVNFNDNKMKFI